MSDDKKNYTNSIEEQFEFLVKELEYEIIDRENGGVWKYVRYRNIKKKRLISVNVDLRDNDIDITLWRLTEKNEELDSNSVYLSELIRHKKINVKLKSLPPKALTNHPTKKVIDGIFKQRAGILKKYFNDLIHGDSWV